ncbi:MAG TPA: hypothetical protein VJ877_05660, partial [Bacteroidales bacterium]|nr:hypothetical protein [Bacteroidales bacterium]
MKKSALTILLVFCAIYITAQVPDAFSYQAVIRNSAGQEITNQDVGIQITILQNTTPVYVEQFTTATNKYGLVTINIGDGTPQSGDFNTIDWSSGPYFINVEVDEAGGTTYVDMGTSQLLSVPYALHAKTSEDAFSGNYEDLTDLPTSTVTDSAYFAKLLAVDEDYIDFGTFENFTNSSDWSIIESVMMPAGTGADGGWHFFRGLGWEDKEGDVAITISTTGIHAWVRKSGWHSVYHTTTLLEETWYEICLQYDATNQTLTLFVDGSQTDQLSSILPQNDASNTNKMFWGGQDVLPEDNQG